MLSVSNLTPLAIVTPVVLSLPPEGRAASFDCAKASTPHEKHLCADPALSAADGRMGESYRAALRSFPVKGFMQATRRRFLIDYGFCDTPGGESCKDAIEGRIADLEAMRSSLVFSDGKPGTPFSPDDGVFWMPKDRYPPVIHYFGGFMPDMNVPEGLCLRRQGSTPKDGNGVDRHRERDEIVVSDKEVRAKISCSARNGLQGTFKRVVEPAPSKATR